MSLSTIAAKWATAYEQEYGERPSDMVLQIAEHIMKVRKRLTELAQKDAMEGMKPCSADDLQALVLKAFSPDPDRGHETVNAVADLWLAGYMDGYCAIAKIEQQYPRHTSRIET